MIYDMVPASPFYFYISKSNGCHDSLANVYFDQSYLKSELLLLKRHILQDEVRQLNFKVSINRNDPV